MLELAEQRRGPSETVGLVLAQRVIERELIRQTTSKNAEGGPSNE